MSLEGQLKDRGSCGHISTLTGEEIAYFGSDNNHSKLQKLTTSFIETDQTARLLKLGQVKQIITQLNQGEVSTIQARVRDPQGKSGVLINTVVGKTLPDTLISGILLENATTKIM